jgi:hypothetical protein
MRQALGRNGALVQMTKDAGEMQAAMRKLRDKAGELVSEAQVRAFFKLAVRGVHHYAA